MVRKKAYSPIRKNMLFSYIKMFFISSLAVFLIYIILVLSNQLIQGKLINYRIDINDFLTRDYTQVDYAPILEHNGGIVVLNNQLEVVHEAGEEFLNVDHFTPTQWAEFLMQSQKIDAPYSYQVAYSNEQDGYWLITAIPASVRMMFSLYYNTKMTQHDRGIVIPFLLILGVLFILIFMGLTWIYTQSTAKIYIRPITELEHSLKAFSDGDYQKRIKISKKNIMGNLAAVYNQMADKIQHEIKTRRELILNISHDIKNPLMSASGYCQYLINNPKLTDNKRMNYYKIIYNDSMRAAKLADDLLELSKLENGDFKIKRERTEICEFVREQIAQMIPLLEEEGFAYTFEIPSKNIYCDIDKGLMGRAIDNLLTNAMKYNGQGTMISISILEEENRVDLNFEDNGVGISKELYKDIIKPFVRGEDEYKAIHGSGLGLSIVNKIVQLHGGEFLFDTERKIGCRFTLRLIK